MASEIPNYYQTEKEFESIHQNIKQVQCRFCRAIGTFILHGYLYGYDDSDASTKVRRGHRLFCSNRNRKEGCGKTVSILKSTVIKHLKTTTKILWKFLVGISKGTSRLKAYRKSGGDLTTSSVYRLYSRFVHGISAIRTCLLRLMPPPLESTRCETPSVQTIAHLQSAFGNEYCPIEQYQSVFQTSFF